MSLNQSLNHLAKPTQRCLGFQHFDLRRAALWLSLSNLSCYCRPAETSLGELRNSLAELQGDRDLTHKLLLRAWLSHTIGAEVSEEASQVYVLRDQRQKIIVQLNVACDLLKEEESADVAAWITDTWNSGNTVQEAIELISTARKLGVTEESFAGVLQAVDSVMLNAVQAVLHLWWQTIKFLPASCVTEDSSENTAVYSTDFKDKLQRLVSAFQIKAGWAQEATADSASLLVATEQSCAW